MPAHAMRYLSVPPASASTPSAFTSIGSVPSVWYASTKSSAPRAWAMRAIAATSCLKPFTKYA